MRRSSWSTIRILMWMGIAVFVLFYPLMVSIYVFLPLFVGFAGLLIIRGIDGKGYKYITIPILYLINLEANLSLPLLLSIFAILLYYLTLYGQVVYLKRCKVCVAVLSVAFIDIFYLLSLLAYDAVMDTQSLVVDKLLWFSLISDIVMAVL